MKNKRIVAYIFYSVNIIEMVEKHRQMIINYAKENLNAKESDIDFYIDICKREDRKEINKMMEKIKDKQYDILLLVHIDNLYKIHNEKDYENIKNLNKIVDTILENGVELVSIMENKGLKPRDV